MSIHIRPVQLTDAQAITTIYNHYIAHSDATFEETCINHQEMARRITAITLDYPWLIAEANNELFGYAYAGKWKERSAYQHTTEVTVYLSHSATGKGIGKQLYQALFEALHTINTNAAAQNPNNIARFHMLMAVITLPNPNSVKLHEALGFSQTGHFQQVGRKFGQWLDVGFWQRPL